MLMSPVLSVFESLFFREGLLEMPEGLHVDLVTHLWNFGESIIFLGGPLNPLSDPLTNLGMGQAPLFGNFETASYLQSSLNVQDEFRSN